jgi:hypothetical protein
MTTSSRMRKSFSPFFLMAFTRTSTALWTSPISPHPQTMFPTKRRLMLLKFALSKLLSTRSHWKVGEEAWSVHLHRNQSVVVDLCHGQLRSSLVCSICSKASTTFDPFTFLSLPLPIDDFRYVELVHINDPAATPKRYSCRVRKGEGTIADLRAALSEASDTPLDSLVVVDVGRWAIGSVLFDSASTDSIRDGESVIAFTVSGQPMSLRKRNKVSEFLRRKRLREENPSAGVALTDEIEEEVSLTLPTASFILYRPPKRR